MPIVIANPASPAPIGWESVTENNARPFTIIGSYINMWLLPDDTILVKSGGNSKDLAIFSPATGLWTEKNDLLENSRWTFAVFHPITGNPVAMPTALTQNALEYDIGLDSWSAVSMPAGRAHSQGGTCNLADGDVMSFSSASVAIQQDYATSWDGASFSSRANIPTSPLDNEGYSMPFASSNDNVYLFGNRGSGSASDVVYKYNISGNTWSTTTSMPEPHLQCVVVPLDGTRAMIIGGGETGANGSSDKVYIFDSATDTFTVFAGVRTPENPIALATSMNESAAVLQADSKVLFLDASTMWRTTEAP